MNIENNEPGYPIDINKSLHNEAGNSKHLEGFSEEEKRMIELMADIFVKSVLNS